MIHQHHGASHGSQVAYSEYAPEVDDRLAVAAHAACRTQLLSAGDVFKEGDPLGLKAFTDVTLNYNTGAAGMDATFRSVHGKRPNESGQSPWPRSNTLSSSAQGRRFARRI